MAVCLAALSETVERLLADIESLQAENARLAENIAQLSHNFHPNQAAQ
jgi:hypothetical protein